jgi:hypothetical protein
MDRQSCLSESQFKLFDKNILEWKKEHILLTTISLDNSIKIYWVANEDVHVVFSCPYVHEGLSNLLNVSGNSNEVF